MNENQALQLRDNARSELMQIKDIETGIGYLNKVKGIEVWAKAEKKDAELQNIIAEQKIRTQRILGQLIKVGQEAGEIAEKGDRNDHFKYNTEEDLKPKTLSDIGITAKQSSTFQTIASIPDDLFETAIIEKKQAVEQAVNELTTAGMMKFAKEVEQNKRKQEAEISERDRKLIDELKKGKTVVINQRTDLATIKWAEDHGKYIRCDRFSDWGNPYEMDKDGNRDDVCYNYKYHYIEFKPSLLSKIHTLKGKALGCWCAPEKCHCDTLKDLAGE
jgi:hypothetical protein